MIPFLRPTALALGILAIAPLAAAQTPPEGSGDNGWRTVIYPVRAWLPVSGWDVRLPEVPGDPGSGSTTPEATVSGNFSGAYAAGLRIERRRLSIDGAFLWAGMSGEVGTPFAKLEVDTVAGRLFGGVRVLPSFYIDAGVRRLALKMTASILQFPAVTWKPGIWEPALGFTYRPQFGSTFRILAQGNVGGIGDSDHRTAEFTATAEWKPAAHFLLGAGYGVLWLRVDGTLRDEPVHLRQTLKGPTFVLGVPF